MSLPPSLPSLPLSSVLPKYLCGCWARLVHSVSPRLKLLWRHYFCAKSLWLKDSHWRLNRDLLKYLNVLETRALSPGWLLVGGIIVHPSKGSGVQASLSPESKLESQGGSGHHSRQGWEDLKEHILLWKRLGLITSVCGGLPHRPSPCQDGHRSSSEVGLGLWLGWGCSRVFEGSSGVASVWCNYSLPREQHVAGESVSSGPALWSCVGALTLCRSRVGLRGGAAAQRGGTCWLSLNSWKSCVSAETEDAAGGARFGLFCVQLSVLSSILPVSLAAVTAVWREGWNSAFQLDGLWTVDGEECKPA